MSSRIDINLGAVLLSITTSSREETLWLLEQLGLDAHAGDQQTDVDDEDLDVDEDLAEAIIGAVQIGHRSPEAIARAVQASDHRTRRTLGALRQLGRLVYVDSHRCPPTGPDGRRGGGWSLPKEHEDGAT